MNALDDETVNECDNYFSIYECGGKSAIHRTSKRAQHQTLSGKYPCSKKNILRHVPKRYTVCTVPSVFNRTYQCLKINDISLTV